MSKLSKKSNISSTYQNHDKSWQSAILEGTPKNMFTFVFFLTRACTYLKLAFNLNEYGGRHLIARSVDSDKNLSNMSIILIKKVVDNICFFQQNEIRFFKNFLKKTNIEISKRNIL